MMVSTDSLHFACIDGKCGQMGSAAHCWSLWTLYTMYTVKTCPSQNATLCSPFPAETAVNIAYACNIFEDEMDEIFIVEGKDDETIWQELRYRWESCHSPSLDPRFPTHLFTQYGPHHILCQNEERRKEEGKTKRT